MGYHFPTIVVDKACRTLGVTLTETGRVVQSSLAFLDDETRVQHQITKKKRAKRVNKDPPFDLTLSQAIIDTHAREAIKDLFPKIPQADLHEIVARAFQKVDT